MEGAAPRRRGTDVASGRGRAGARRSSAARRRCACATADRPSAALAAARRGRRRWRRRAPQPGRRGRSPSPSSPRRRRCAPGRSTSASWCRTAHGGAVVADAAVAVTLRAADAAAAAVRACRHPRAGDQQAPLCRAARAARRRRLAGRHRRRARGRRRTLAFAVDAAPPLPPWRAYWPYFALPPSRSRSMRCTSGWCCARQPGGLPSYFAWIGLPGSR